MLNERVKAIVDAIGNGDFDDDQQLYHLDIALQKRFRALDTARRNNDDQRARSMRSQLDVLLPTKAQSVDPAQCQENLDKLTTAVEYLKEMDEAGERKIAARFSIEIHGVMRNVKKHNDKNWDKAQLDQFMEAARGLLIHGFGLDPDDMKGDGFA